MSYMIKQNLANKNNYGNKRDTSSIKYIVIHYTANDGDTDENNGNYFKNNIVKASAHYFVDDDSVTQSVPDNYIAYSVGGSKYASCSTTGGGKHHGKCTNANSISIEICDDVRNGVVYPSAKTIKNVIELTKKKMEEYNISKENVIRHFDVTGKYCPAYWCGNSTKNSKWKSEFLDKLTEKSVALSTSSIETLAKKGVIDSPDYWEKKYKDLKYLDNLLDKLAKATTSKKVNDFDDVKTAIDHLVKCKVIDTPSYWTKNYSKIQYLDSLIIKAANYIQFEYVVRVTANALNIRKGAGTKYDVVGVIKDKGSYTIVDEKKNGTTTWGLLKSYRDNRDGWISLKYTKKI